MGMHGQDTAELIFEDCRVPVANILGEEGKGFYYIMQKFQTERLCAALMAQAAAEAMLDVTIKYCKERQIFGKPVSSFQHNTFKIVEMATEIELGRTLINDLIADYIAGVDITKRVSMAKAWIPEMVNRVAYHCVQLHGGYGYMEEYRHLQDGPRREGHRDLRGLDRGDESHRREDDGPLKNGA